MASNNTTITINGRQYDAKTGLPIATAEPKSPVTDKAPVKKAAAEAKRPAPKTPAGTRSAQAAAAIHASGPARSQTLRRRAVKKPVAPTKIVRNPRPSTSRHMDIARSTQVTKFAPHPAAAVKTNERPAAAAHTKPVASAARPATKAQPHPIAKRAIKRQDIAKVTRKPAAVSTKDIKDAEIRKAIAAKPAAQSKKQVKKTKASLKKNSSTKLWRKRTIILTGVAVLALLAVVAATQIFPGLSVQVASIRSGVSAAYPKYIPDGYSLSQPVKYSDGNVAITFKSNSNPTQYTLSQSSSSWDSSAVLDNLVKKEAGNNYVTTRERGLTIFTYKTSAAWVNAGTLYIIEGTADLSGEQVRKIATSL